MYTMAVTEQEISKIIVNTPQDQKPKCICKSQVPPPITTETAG
jgi:hypothetical protein